MWKRKPCQWCGGPKPAGIGLKVCGECRLVDTIWEQLLTGPNGCWLWPGRLFKGYGQVGDGFQPHRLTYEELIGEIPDGLHLDHLCRVPRCCNPWHLDPVTPAENNRRKWAVYSRCKSGHEFTPENTYRSPSGKRSCRACGRRWSAEYWHRKVA